MLICTCPSHEFKVVPQKTTAFRLVCNWVCHENFLSPSDSGATATPSNERRGPISHILNLVEALIAPLDTRLKAASFGD
jgi:hypothetical protein